MPDNSAVPALSLVEPKADNNSISPAAPSPAAPPPAAEGAEYGPQGAPETLPKELVRLPVMQALIAGAPPAVSANIKEFSTNPAAELIKKNANALKQAGMGFYRSIGGDMGVLFNQFKIHGADILAADKAGKLTLLAPPFDQVNHGIAKSGLNNPVLKKGAGPQSPAPASPTLVPPPQMAQAGPQAPAAPPPMIKPATAGLQKQVMAVRAGGLVPKAPTAGPAPGAGRILNQILTPTV
ncbi:MAG TPA: hypothetical protein VLF94_07885 [Chlamydiales bacterium]|nr:hypothetical protein [Chlamydiales bacterium]